MLRERHDVRHAINELNKLLPPEIARTPQAKRLLQHGCVTTMDIVQLIYRPDEPQGYLKDFEFSRPTMKQRWQQGLVVVARRRRLDAGNEADTKALPATRISWSVRPARHFGAHGQHAAWPRHGKFRNFADPQQRLTCRSAESRTGVPPSSVTRSPGLSPPRSAADRGSTA
jgi:hypothetical protein